MQSGRQRKANQRSWGTVERRDLEDLHFQFAIDALPVAASNERDERSGVPSVIRIFVARGLIVPGALPGFQVPLPEF